MPTVIERQRLLAPLLLSLLVGGCAARIATVSTLSPTVPDAPRVSQASSGLGRGTRVLVLSPTSLQQVSGSLTGETTDAASTAGSVATGVAQTTDFNIAVSAGEAALLNAGYQPVSQAALTRAVEERASGLRGRTLLQQAVTIGQATGAPYALLFRSIQLEYPQRGEAALVVRNVAAGCSDFHLLPLISTVDAVVVRVENGDVVWTGRATVRGTDLLRGPVEVSYGADCIIPPLPGVASLLCGELGPARPCATFRPERSTVERIVEATTEKLLAALR